MDDSGAVPKGICGFTLEPGRLRPDADDEGWDETDEVVYCTREMWAERDTDRCVWHADIEGKTGADLPDRPSEDTERLDGAVFCGAELDMEDRLRRTGLRDTALTDADLNYADLTNADIHIAHLTDALLPQATLIDVDLEGALLTDAVLPQASLTDANLRLADLTNTDLTNADLREAVLTNANIRGTDFTGADLRRITLSDNTQVDRGTRIGKQLRAEQEVSDPGEWDTIARSYHQIKRHFSSHGLTEKARMQYLYERWARRREARARGGWGYWTYLKSLASRIITGYGVRVRQVLFNIAFVLTVSTAAFAVVGVRDQQPDTLVDVLFDSVYFSVITFTTAGFGQLGPEMPAVRAIAMVEAFVGTVLIVLLGYVLANRETV